MQLEEAHYKVAWRNTGNYPGHHASLQQGGGLDFHHHASLVDAPDPRRFDLRASLRDPFGQIQVRVYQQTSAIPVHVIADLSASMGFVGASPKMQVLARLVACLAYSAYRTGDSFGFVGCAEQPLEELLQRPTLNRGAGLELADRLRNFEPRGRHSDGLLRAADLIGTRRSLVFLISDFHCSTELIEDVMGTLRYHDVVPVLLWDRREINGPGGYGLARVMDPETRRSRLLFVRPALRRRIAQRYSERRERLFETFSRLGRPPLTFEDGFDADAITRYFYG
ncbi:MAG: DUF58 domain-containing protein [Gammaproteobacteria bacterium]|jgi:uncharacterized protein (DUF58 family)